MERGTKSQEEYLKELEAEVAARTAELRDANASLKDQITKRTRAENILFAMLEATSSVAGDEFLRSLVRSLAAALKFKYALVGEFASGAENIRTLAVWADGKFAENLEYALAGTPCEKAVGKELCAYPKGVQALFPEDRLLADMGVESYIGVPLFDSQGKAAGILVALNDKPFEDGDEEQAKTLLRLFALRASLELQRKRAEEEKKKSVDMLQSILDNSMAVIYMKDSDGKFMLINKWYEEQFRVKRLEIIGKTDYDLFPKEVADKLRANDLKVIEGQRPVEFEEEVLELDGTVHTYVSIKFPIQGLPGAVCGISTDITERKKIGAALLRSEERLNEAQRTARIGSWDWDIVENRLHWSDEIYRIFGLPPQEFGATYEAFLRSVHPDDRDTVSLAVKEALEKGKAYELNHRIVLPDGTERIVNEKAAVSCDGNGKPFRMAGTVQDITDQKRVEAEILKAQKLDSIGVLAGGIAHDFNNLLLGILGNVSVARNYLKPGDKVSGILIEIEKAALRTKGLTRQLLTFSKGGEPVREVSAIDELIRDCAELVLRGTNVDCEYAFQEGLWPVEMDQGQISQAINNIIHNAQQSMPDGGAIKISAENLSINEGGALPLKPGKYIKTTIRDFGIGIPPKILQKVFDPFFTTRQKASGLGLAVTYSIIKKHQGHIAVESVVGEGTSFHVYLPASAKVNFRAGDERIERGKGKVLVMDDEELVRDVTDEMLKLLGYEAVFALDGREAVEAFRKAYDEGSPFDAVILDLTVPGGIGGKETVKKLLEIDPEVKAIVSSGYSKDPVMADFRSYGFTAVIAKPYRVSEFGKVVKEVIGKSA